MPKLFEVFVEALQSLLGIVCVVKNVLLDASLLHFELFILLAEAFPQLEWEVMQVKELMQVFLTRHYPQLV